MDNSLNEEIAKFFLSDSLEFLKRYKVLKANQTHIGNRSKLLIDIVFSFECSFKALIFLESSEGEKETYKKIKTHKLNKLIEFVDVTSIQDIISIIDKNIEYFSIGSRYMLEAQINFRNEYGVLDGKYYSTIADFNWLENLYENAEKLYNYVNSKIKYLVIQNLKDINIEKELERSNRIRNINAKMI